MHFFVNDIAIYILYICYTKRELLLSQILLSKIYNNYANPQKKNELLILVTFEK